jgi:hypothetical protein
MSFESVTSTLSMSTTPKGESDRTAGSVSVVSISLSVSSGRLATESGWMH